MVSLTLREIADSIGMHESTVCRVTSNKWVATPWGVYELKAFFPSQIAGRGQESSGTAVRAMIRRIINAENRATPLSDGEITALLARQRSEEHTSELQSLMRISYAVFCLKKKKITQEHT